MKKKIMLAALFVVGCTWVSKAQNTPVVDKRQNIQQERIKEGVEDGDLTKIEAARLRQEQKQIRRTERRAKADGEVSAVEKAKIDRQQTRASVKIAKQKHDKHKQN